MISVVIPAYNESEIIGKVIGELIIELNKNGQKNISLNISSCTFFRSTGNKPLKIEFLE